MENERKKEISDHIDKAWDAHIIACLAIITAWQERERNGKQGTNDGSI